MNRRVLSALCFVLLASTGALVAQDDTSLEAALTRAGENRSELEAALNRAPEAQKEALAFLIRYMPQPDLRSLDADFLLENLELAHSARDKAPWAARLSDDLFRNAVLPYANVSEPRHPWRREFRKRFLTTVADCKSPGEAAKRLNATIFKELGVRYSTKRKRADQSPKESIEQGLASCSGLSIILINACRSVGVPARFVGTPSWAKKRGNHSWVEVWDEGWHFLGAAEPGELNRTWFQADAAAAVPGGEHAILATSWEPTGSRFPLVFRPDWTWVHAEDVSARYTAPKPKGCRLLIDVVDAAGRRHAREVTVRSGGKELKGTSADESRDMNDILAFDLERSASALVEFEGQQQMIRLDGDQQRLRFLLEESGLTKAQRAALTKSLARAFTRVNTKGLVFPPALEDLLIDHESEVRALAWETLRGTADKERQADMLASRVRFGAKESPYVLKKVGKKPEGGWPLFVAMHGGGGVPKEFNDSQWRHMQIYYREHPELGGYLYLALRAPTDEWNGFYTSYMYPLMARLIGNFLRFEDVNPNRVFAMGYSHGGYGAFAMGPTMPDRFAGVHASASAPTPGESPAVNLHNLDFSFMIGERDTAYGRAERCQAFAKELDQLRGDREGVYRTRFEWKEGVGHGGLPDRDKIVELYPLQRRPHPTELVWHPTNGGVVDHYWLHVPKAKAGQKIRATIVDRRQIRIESEGVEELELWLDGRLVDLAARLTIEWNGKSREVSSRPSLRYLAQSLVAREDPELSATVRIRLSSKD